MSQHPTNTTSPAAPGSERDILLTLFDLGREVASVIDVDALLHKIPQLIGRLIPFDALAVYLLNEKRDDIRIGYAVGYPEEARQFHLGLSEGVVGRVIATQESLVIGDVTMDPHYIGVVPGMTSTLAV